MKSSIDLPLGSRHRAQVLERLSGESYIVSFNGDLLRVSNKTPQVWQSGEYVDLVVVAVNPVQFRLESATLSFARHV